MTIERAWGAAVLRPSWLRRVQDRSGKTCNHTRSCSDCGGALHWWFDWGNFARV